MADTIEISVIKPSEFAWELQRLRIHRNRGVNLLRYGARRFAPPREIRQLHIEGMDAQRILATEVSRNRTHATWTLHFAIITTDSRVLKGEMIFSSAAKQADDPPYGHCLLCRVGDQVATFPVPFPNGRVRIIARADIWGGTSIETGYVHGCVDRIFLRELERDATAPPEIIVNEQEVILRHTAPELRGIRYQFRPRIGDDEGWRELLSFAQAKAAELATAS